MQEVLAFDNKAFKCKPVDPYYIFEHIEEFNIRQITLDHTNERPNMLIKFNDADYPVTYTTGFWGDKVYQSAKNTTKNTKI